MFNITRSCGSTFTCIAARPLDLPSKTTEYLPIFPKGNDGEGPSGSHHAPRVPVLPFKCEAIVGPYNLTRTIGSEDGHSLIRSSCAAVCRRSSKETRKFCLDRC